MDAYYFPPSKVKSKSCYEMADALLDWAYHSNQTLPGTAVAGLVAANRSSYRRSAASGSAFL